MRSQRSFLLFLPITIFLSKTLKGMADVIFSHANLKDGLVAVVAALVGGLVCYGVMLLFSKFGKIDKPSRPKMARYPLLVVFLLVVTFTGTTYFSAIWAEGKNHKAEILPSLITGLLLTPWFYLYIKYLQKAEAVYRAAHPLLRDELQSTQKATL